MAIEKERKFLLNYLPQGIMGVDIKQAYLMTESKKQLRVRIINEKEANLTFKTEIGNHQRLEYEFEIPLVDAKELYLISDLKLEKRRYTIWTSKGFHFDIDIYPNGYQIVEIEYKDKFPEELPDFVGEEITGNLKYSNYSIAVQNLLNSTKKQ